MDKTRGVLAFLFVVVVGWMLLTWLYDKSDTTELIKEAQSNIEQHVEQEAARHRAVLDKVQEVKVNAQKEVLALKPDGVAAALNSELQLFRSSIRSERVDNPGNRVLLFGGRRSGDVNSADNLQADK